MIAASMPVVCSRAATESRPSASTWNVTRMRAAPGDHRRNAAQLEARQRAAVGDPLALALHDVDRHRGLAVLEGGEFLGAGDRDRRVARNDLLGQAAHRLQAQRQRNHVEQQPVLVLGAIAGEHVGLDRRAERDDLVRIEIVERRLRRKTRHGSLDLRHARCAADHHHAVDVGRRELRVAQRLAHRQQRLGDEGLR